MGRSCILDSPAGRGMPAAVRRPAAVQMPAWHGRRFKGVPPAGRLAYAQPLSPWWQVSGSMAFVTDSNRPQPLWQPPSIACLTASGAASDVPSFVVHPCPERLGHDAGKQLWSECAQQRAVSCFALTNGVYAGFR